MAFSVPPSAFILLDKEAKLKVKGPVIFFVFFRPFSQERGYITATSHGFFFSRAVILYIEDPVHFLLL